MLSGLPCSGKTTKAAEICAQNKKCVRVHPDLITGMLYFQTENAFKQRHSIGVTTDVAIRLLRDGYSVVIDGVNLDNKSRELWKSVADVCEVPFEEVPLRPKLNFCIFHDAWKLGNDSLGFDVINAMAMRHKLMEQPPREFVLIDIDSMMRDTLDPKSETYLKDMRLNPIQDSYLARIQELATMGYKIIFYSKLNPGMKGLLMDWLNSYGLWKGDLGFTPVTLFVGLTETQIYKMYFKNKYQIFRVISNNKKGPWETHGIYVETLNI